MKLLNPGAVENESIANFYCRIGLSEFLTVFPGLTVEPQFEPDLLIRGTISFCVAQKQLIEITDSYLVEIKIPLEYPKKLPTVWEKGNRIPREFHTNADNSLCLGSPFRLRLAVRNENRLLPFVTRCLIPYLYGFSHRERYGSLPFGELAHGRKGILADYGQLIGIEDPEVGRAVIALLAMKKRLANKLRCPCGSGRRVGRCHHRTINRLRDLLGRRWFWDECNELRGSDS